MNAQMVDYDTVLANLETLKATAKTELAAQNAIAKAEYEAKIAKYDEAMVIMDELFKTADNGAQKSVNGSKELSSKAFANMTVLEATKSYLEFCKRAQTSEQLAEALKKHGIKSSSKEFLKMLKTVLYKCSKDSKGVVRINGKKWRLSSHRTTKTVDSA